MRTNTIHIVCLDAPAPPDYGGAIDMFYKVKALHESGVEILLHYFDYRDGRSAESLKTFCKAVYSYTRKPFLRSLPFQKPFIIQSRINQELIDCLNGDDYPILLEGLHCAGIIPSIRNKTRVVLRMHNEEASYYRHLAKTEKKSFLKQLYFSRESHLIKQYQRQMTKDIQLACLSETDITEFVSAYNFRNVSFIPCFIPWQTVSCKEGKGNYCLYHGNLSVPENEQAAAWLMDNVFCQLDVPLLVAGSGISDTLKQKAQRLPNVRLIPDPSIEEIDQLVANAHINVLPSLNRTGVKLKLLNALWNGRFCLTNNAGVMGSRINGSVIIAETKTDWIDLIPKLMQQAFSLTESHSRQVELSLYNNRSNAEKLIALWKHCQ